ncbi:hypothetical protein QCA50_001425 [Cerrena zonata]|uniref:3'-5' exonuclease domain-containing protein n=1 Tax=Cerrena zonata TaxID=2478898 RepID=A0AAW0GM00_9APHY
MSRPYQRRGTGNASTSQRGGHQTSRGGARRPEQSTGPRNQPTNSSQAAPQRPLQQRPPKIQYPIYSWRIFSPNASIRYARDIPTTDFYLSMLSGNILGFDLEWQPTFVKGGSRNPVALVQLADANVMILIQVSAMQEFPQTLRTILENPHIVKTGVAIQDDCKHLWADWRVNCRNVVDLSLFARTVDNANWKGSYKSSIGLSRLCETYFNLALNKGRVQRSNWTNVLSEAQLEYAANDCHSGYMIYTRLLQRLPAVVPPPERKYYTFDCLDGYLHSPCMSNETGLLWEPWNPNYDPGPPPELSEKRKEKEAALATLAQLPLAVAPDPRERRARPQAGPSSSRSEQVRGTVIRCAGEYFGSKRQASK